MLVGVGGNRSADLHRHRTDVRKRRIERTLGQVSVRDERCQHLGCHEEHPVGHPLRAAEHRAETERRKYVAVVALTRHKRLAFVFDRIEGRPGGKERLALRCRVGLFGRAFGLGSRIRKREDDRTLVELGHFFENFLRKGLRLAGHADDGSRLQGLDRFEEARRIRRIDGKRLLMRGQIRTSLRDETLRVKEVAVCQGILTRETVVDQRIGKQIGDAAGSLAGAEEEELLIWRALPL